jgi:adenosylhomocysteine nucleosidase
MTGLIMATPMEAAPLLTRAGLAPVAADAPLPLLIDLRPAREIVLCLCGMGPARAQAGTRLLLARHAITHIINAGVAGALSDELAVAGVYRITRTFRWPAGAPVYECEERWPTLPGVVLATSDEPVFDPVLRAAMARHAQVVDMEGAAVAAECRESGIPFAALKGITDRAGTQDRSRLLRNLSAVSAAVAEQLWQEA